jgi:hypothetical protein
VSVPVLDELQWQPAGLPVQADGQITTLVPVPDASVLYDLHYLTSVYSVNSCKRASATRLDCLLEQMARRRVCSSRPSSSCQPETKQNILSINQPINFCQPINLINKKSMTNQSTNRSKTFCLLTNLIKKKLSINQPNQFYH